MWNPLSCIVFGLVDGGALVILAVTILALLHRLFRVFGLM